MTTRFLELSETISEPWILLKACTSPQEMRAALPSRWFIEPPGFMMTREATMPSAPALSAGYTLDAEADLPISVVRIIAPSGELAAIRRVVTVDDWAIYDRVETQENHRRRGFACSIMKALEGIAISRNATRGVLVATAAGRTIQGIGLGFAFRIFNSRHSGEFASDCDVPGSNAVRRVSSSI